MTSLYLGVALSLTVAFFLRLLIRKLGYRSISNLPGPPPNSWLIGNFDEVMRPKEVGDNDFKWIREYGTALRIKGTFGMDILFLADPKALQYVFNTGGYNFPKPPETRLSVALTTGKGIAWAEGQQHLRHRKIMSPAFSFGALRVFLPLFRHTAQTLVARFKGFATQGGGTLTVLDIPPWMARTTLDAVGAAAFDYQFRAIEEGAKNELSKAYNNLFADAFFQRSDGLIIFEGILARMPQYILDLTQYVPSKQLRRLKDYMKLARKAAKSIVTKQSELYAAGKEGSKDIMSLLIRANLSENPQTKLSEEEILCQLTTLILAGHETTASTMTWALYELSRHQEFQGTIREEIKATRARAAQRGDTELSVADLDSMKNLLALMKETLRFHPIVSTLIRMAGREDRIPLSVPIKTKTGEMIDSILVSKGQRILISVSGYGRLKSVWGENADEWMPQRFLEGVERNQTTALGVTANVATFSSGLRSCIGWRFAMIEMQTILLELLENFEFSPPPGNVEIIRGPTGIMTPM
ncbi:PAH-inducible cytochrome P450 monooxygenase PC-PAH 1 [Ramaria rubella]|nr:PAH-inducible cytochrome P450 monooxygenase PC-PAH 1 [Ramaria rubella]